MYLCVCRGVTEQDVTDRVNESQSCFLFAGIATALKGSGSCCKCLPRTREVIDEANKAKSRNNSTPTS